MLASLLILVSFLCIAVIYSCLVLLSPRVERTVKLFLILSIGALTEWVLSLYFSNVASSYALLFNRTVYIGPLLAIVSFSFFLDFAFQIKKKVSVPSILITAITIPIIFIAVSSWNVLGIKPRLIEGRQVGYEIIPGPGSALFILLFLIIALLLIFKCIAIYRQSSHLDKRGLKVVFTGLTLFLFVGLVSSLILPPLTGGSGIANDLSGLAVLEFMGSLVFSVLRYKLLEVRLIVIRYMAYALSIATFTGIYILLSFLLLNNLLLNKQRIALKEGLYSATLALVLALTFPYFKNFFNKLTRKIFYQDAYDPQVFLAAFNKALVTNYRLEPLLSHGSKIIKEYLKPEKCLFGIKETRNTPRRILGDVEKINVTNAQIEYIQKLTPKLNQHIIVTDKLGEDQGKLKDILTLNGIALLVRLTPRVSQAGIGYIVIGNKKSGNLYSAQDLRVIEIIANELVIAIQNIMRFEEIDEFNETLKEKVHAATRRLRATNEKLKALDEAKDDFVSMASHQLRTPLTSVKGNISLVLDGDAGDITPIQRQLLEQAFTSSQRMVYLIADLLNVSRLKTGKFVIEQAPVDLANIVQEEVNQLIDTAKSRRLELNYQKPDNISPLMLDETKTRQVIMNFVDNAIYYTPAGGHIRVELTETDSAVECRVIDDGIGVPKHEQHHLFSKFYRAGNARKARPDGTGLGLFMAKKVIIAEGGAIIFDTQEGKGSTFGFSFPKASLAVPANVSSDPTLATATA